MLGVLFVLMHGVPVGVVEKRRTRSPYTSVDDIDERRHLVPLCVYTCDTQTQLLCPRYDSTVRWPVPDFQSGAGPTQYKCGGPFLCVNFCSLAMTFCGCP